MATTLMAVWFIAWGALKFIPHGPDVDKLMGVLAALVGILILLGK